VHAAPASSSNTVQGLYDALLGTMKNGRLLGQSGRFTQLEPVIRRSFDLATMARLSVGPSWASMSEAQRQQVTESFGRYISAISRGCCDRCAGEKGGGPGERRTAGGVMEKGKVVRAKGERVKVDSQMRRDGGGGLIPDIYLGGPIREGAPRRSEFGAILKT